MPITPLHFGPSAVVSLPLSRYLDVPVFILANVMIDLEPLSVFIFRFDYPLHGYAHTYLFGSLLGALLAVIAFYAYPLTKKLMTFFSLDYQRNFVKMLLSGILGVAFHVFLDSFLYADIQPFYPLDYKPMYGLLSHSFVYNMSMLAFIPAIALYLWQAGKLKRTQSKP